LNNILAIAINTPFNQLFDYLCDEVVLIGCRVEVPFGKQTKIGIVVEVKNTSDYELSKLKNINKVLDEKPLFDKTTWILLNWCAKYYHHPLTEVITTALPKRLREGKEAVIKQKKEPTNFKIEKNFQLNQEQKNAIETIQKSTKFTTFLLHGVTGSGKTEVYLELIKQYLAQDKQVLILIPEIGLTPQMVNRFETSLQISVSVFHSQLTETEKVNTYLLARDGQAKVILGTRSAIFMPIKNLGIIIIDEEHDDSFKQQSSLRYSARDLSYVRAKENNIPLILGSATPSLETLNNVLEKKITRLTLKKRAGNAKPPKINIIDMRGNYEILSEFLLAQITKTLSNNKQVMLFINRRGYAPVYFCKNCQWRANCSHCSTGMVYHRGKYRLQCHHCGSEELPPQACPKCSQHSLEVLGFGTERIEELLLAKFPKTPIIRIDRDTTKRKKQLENNLEKIHQGDPCIIIGTQMLAKGHDFSNLALVGVLNVDVGFLSVDFRATEKLAQLLLQVAGRAGRSDALGEVFIQTQNPHHPMFSYIPQSHYTQYANMLLQERKQTNLPPYSYQTLICANAKNKENAEIFLTNIEKKLQEKNIPNLEVFGPVDAMIEKKSNYFYMNLWLQSNHRPTLHLAIDMTKKIIEQEKLKNKLRWFLDIDPIES